MEQREKRMFAFALALLLCLSLLPTAALAEEPEGSIAPVEESGRIGETEDVIPIIDSGPCGDSVNWRLTENGALVILGSGDMWDYTVQNAPKWMSSYARQITRIVVMEGVTGIGEKAFFTGPYQIRPEEILLPQSLKKIGNFAFPFPFMETSHCLTDCRRSGRTLLKPAGSPANCGSPGRYSGSEALHFWTAMSWRAWSWRKA